MAGDDDVHDDPDDPVGLGEEKGDEVEETRIQEGSHVVHDGWRGTVAVYLEAMGMTRTMVNHNQGEVVVHDPNAPFPKPSWKIDVPRGTINEKKRNNIMNLSQQNG